MNWRKLFINVSLIILVLIVSFAIMQYLTSMKTTPESKPREEAKLYVRAQQVEYKSNLAEVSATGRLSSQEEVDLSSEVQGQILPGNKILKAGTKFNKGDLLVKIFDEEVKNNLKASKSRFMNGIAAILPDIRIDFPESYQKYQDFFNSIKIDQVLPELPKLDSDKEKVFLASRNILNDYFNIKSAEVRLAKYRLYAPFDGTFTAVYLETGSVANPGSRIASMIRTDKMELEVPVRIEDAYWISVGDKVKLSTKDRHLTWTGKVVRKSNFMDPNSQTITVYVAVSPDNGKPLFPGQYLFAEFASKTLDGTMAIPRNAVFDKNKVFTVEDGLLKENTINILKKNETTVLFSGLTEGVEVVIEPQVNAKEGTKAEILN